LFLKWFPKARIYGFEPLTSIFIFAERGLANGARLYNLGVNSTSGVQTFWKSKLDEASTFDHQNLESNDRKMKSRVLLSSSQKMYELLTVSTIILNDFSLKEKIGKIDLLKVDTEGHELEVMKGAITLLKHRKIELIQIERQETGLRSSKGALESPKEVKKFLNTFSCFKVQTIGMFLLNFMMTLERQSWTD
jgi:FkbM family methyltransferase